jgi:hypothetical protein
MRAVATKLSTISTFSFLWVDFIDRRVDDIDMLQTTNIRVRKSDADRLKERLPGLRTVDLLALLLDTWDALDDKTKSRLLLAHTTRNRLNEPVHAQ